MLPQPKVSVVIPCYKVEAYLDQCVESVLAQTLRDWEIILVDDESPDRVPAMCDAWAARDARIRVIHKKNAGLGMACNSGLSAARGKYVAFLDSDDWVDPEMYETMYQAAERYKAQMVFSGLKRVDSAGKLIGKHAHKPTLMLCSNRKDVDELARDMVASAPHVVLERTIQMSAKVVLYHRETTARHHIRFVSERDVRSEDLHFNLNMLAHSDCVCVLPDFFYNYRCTEGSITQTVETTHIEKIKILYHYTLNECEKLGLGDEGRIRVQRMAIGYTRQYLRGRSRSSLSFAQKREIVKQIISDPMWDDILLSYPIWQTSFAHRIFLHLIRRKMAVAIILLLNYK